jgi:formylglycine-generating enzyme required for sulfatase activity
MRIVAGATAIVGLVLAVLLVPPRLDEARRSVAAWWSQAGEEGEPVPAPIEPSAEGGSEPLEEGDATEEAIETPAPARPEDLADLATFTDTLADGAPCGFCPEMVVIPAGTFTMGSPPDEEGRNEDEGPQREVRVERFALGRYEMTVDQFAAFVDATDHESAGCHVRTGSYWKNDLSKSWRGAGFPQTGTHPARCVSWGDAQRYVEWISQVTGEHYRLPSEAEWEYAARAGTNTRFAFGDELSPSQALFGRSIGITWEVGSGVANAWNVFDMHGNLWEWAEDCWHGSYNGAPENGSVWLERSGGDCSRRVIRGGSSIYPAQFLRSAVREGFTRDVRIDFLGFRVARTLNP